MKDIKEISENEKKQLWQEAKQEFPNDEMMQEIYYVQLLHYTVTKDLIPEELLEYFNSKTKNYQNNRLPISS